MKIRIFMQIWWDGILISAALITSSLFGSYNLAGGPAVVLHVQATEREPFKETTLT